MAYIFLLFCSIFTIDYYCMLTSFLHWILWFFIELVPDTFIV